MITVIHMAMITKRVRCIHNKCEESSIPLFVLHYNSNKYSSFRFNSEDHHDHKHHSPHDHGHEHPPHSSHHHHDDSHHHGHSHDHGEDCSTCGPKLTSPDDVADVDVPEWKKKALGDGTDAAAANSASLLGLNWNVEETRSDTTKPNEAVHHHHEDHGHHHAHEHGHSHDHGHS